MFELGWTQNGPFDAFGWYKACSIHARKSCCVCLDGWFAAAENGLTCLTHKKDMFTNCTPLSAALHEMSTGSTSSRRERGNIIKEEMAAL